LAIGKKFNKSFRTFKALNQQLAQKVYKCVNMFLETGSVLRKKGSRRPTKRSAENIEESEQRIIAGLTQETNLSFDTVQLILKKKISTFFSIVCLLCMKLPLDNKSPHNR
jgi:phosphate uptake regulator